MKFETVRVFCMEMVLDPSVNSVSSFRQWLEKAVEKAQPFYTADQTHKLLVFPEYTSLAIIYNEQTYEKYYQACLQVFSDMGKNEKAYVLASSPSKIGESLYNMAFLFDPFGECVHTTAKCNVTNSEQNLGFISANQEPKAIELPFGKIAIAICLDVFNESYINNLKQQGTQIVLQPSANPQAWAAPAKSSGVWQPLEWTSATVGVVNPRNYPIQYVINPMLHGTDKVGHFFDGQSSIVRASSSFHHCPYVGVEKEFQAEFVYCSGLAESHSSQVGWVDIKL